MDAHIDSPGVHSVQTKDIAGAAVQERSDRHIQCTIHPRAIARQ